MSIQTIYLDYAAATPMDPKVLKAMEPYFSDKFFNPSATYLAAKDVNKDIQNARGTVARQLGARPSEIIFTAGGTEANNLAIHGIMQKYPGKNVVLSVIEHESVLMPAESYEHKLAPVLADGVIDLPKLTKLIDDDTVLVSVMYANNEIGTIQPIHEISKIIENIKDRRQKNGNKTPLFFHTDACQAAAYLDLHVSRLGADLMTINGGKIYGPKQSGALFVKTGTTLQPQILGGGQEWGVRSGTENVAGIIGLGIALDLVQTRRHAEVKRLQALQQHFFGLIQQHVPEAVINGTGKNRLPNNVHLTFPGQDNERLMMELDERGIICAVGSACSASSEEPSHVLKAIGLSDAQAQASLRFTMGHSTTISDIEKTVATLAKSLRD